MAEENPPSDLDAAAVENSVATVEVAGARRSRVAKRIGLVAGVVALVGAVSFGAMALLPGGRSPTDAASGLLTSLGNEDVLGAGESLLPGERRLVLEPITNLVSEAERLGLLDDVDLEGLQGLDIEFDGLTYEVEALGDDVAWVAISGTLTLGVDLADLPFGSLIERYLPEGWEADAGSDAEVIEIGDGFGIAVVKQDGDWYVSAYHSAAEVMRRDADLEFPQDVALGYPAGAGSPEEAMEQAVLALADIDLRAFLDVIDPDETAALRRYSALFIEEWDAGVADLRVAMDDVGFSYSIGDIVTGSKQIGDDTVAWLTEIRQFSISIDMPDFGEVRVVRDGDCLRIDVPPDFIDLLEMAIPDTGLPWGELNGEECIDASAFDEMATADPAAEGDLEAIFDFPVIGPLYERWFSSEPQGGSSDWTIQFLATEHEGRWYISPTGSSQMWWMSFLATLDEGLLTEIGDEIQRIAEDPEAFEDEIYGYIEELATEMGIADALGQPVISPGLLAPYADMPLVFLVWDEDLGAATEQFEEAFGGQVALDVIDGPDLYALWLAAYGGDAVAGLSADFFPSGLLVGPLETGMLVEIFGWPTILDLVPAADLGLG
ncbi:hypothetical protein HQ535_01235 [bacterium]|nr:hypothetical protein [bacterium]